MLEQITLTSNNSNNKNISRVSLRARVALIIAALSFFPNLMLVLLIFKQSLANSNISAFSFLWPLLIWLSLLVVFSLTIARYYSKELLSPLIDMSHNIEKIQENPNGIIGARIELRKQEPIEIYKLKSSFNSLIAHITKEQSQRSNFIASLMHDLKTPLIASGHLLTVIYDANEIERHERLALIEKLKIENKSMIELIQKMVDAHRFEREEIKLNLKPEAIENIVEAVVIRLKSLALKGKIEIDIKGKTYMNVDRLELERAIYNLLSNAIRYANSKIEILISENKIKIIDDGPGLPANLEDLAQPFKSQSITIDGKPYNAGSAGLGLFIANKIITAHKAKLSEKDRAQGTCLEIYFEAANG